MSATTNPGVYPGNPSLPREVKEKILSTFRHTLNLFHEGKLDDCVIGCDFILKMDARFAPARQLLEKAKNPSANVDIEQLEAIVASTPTRQERVVAADPDRLLVRAVESFNAREFDAAICLCQGGFGLLGGRDEVEVFTRIARTVRPGGRLAVSAFSVLFATRFLEPGETLDPATGVLHERTRLRNEQGDERSADLWTTCFTARELELLAALAGVDVLAVHGVTPGRYLAAPPDLDQPELLLVAHRRA